MPSRSVRVLVGLVLLPLLVLLAWGLLHLIRGGTELPPPKWTEADLVPLPPDADNAWYLMGPLEQMPELTIDSELWDDSVPFPEEAWASVDAELARPEVQALLSTVPAVLERPYLAPPDMLDFAHLDVLRMQQWRLWVGLSLNRTLAQDPESAARILSKLFPLWIECANSSRGAITFVLCASGAKRDLDLMVRSAERLLRTGDARSLELLRSAVQDTPPISSDNLMTADYILEYRKLDSMTSNLDGFQVDFKETLNELDAFFEPDQAEVLCAARAESWRHPLYEYNGAGKRAAKAVAGFHCALLPSVLKATKSVAQRRARLLALLKPTG